MIIQQQALGFVWPTLDPFLFCVHHLDLYPKGNGKFGPETGLAGRNIGQDFGGKDNWNMYHGQKIPGFPAHPHRGFETVTITRQGWVDHADSLGGRGRYGEGDIQWMTAGSGLQHSEMFPLLKTDEKNDMELFQIWMNLPAKNKMVEPCYKMINAADIQKNEQTDENGYKFIVEHYFNGRENASKATKHSWASEKQNDVLMQLVILQPNARYSIKKTDKDTNRSLYFYQGDTLELIGSNNSEGKSDSQKAELDLHQMLQVQSDLDITIINTSDKQSRVLILQGKPIGEPVAQHGPFVMNTQLELRQAFFDYQSTQFGGWPFDTSEPTHGEEIRRFAEGADV